MIDRLFPSLSALLVIVTNGCGNPAVSLGSDLPSPPSDEDETTDSDSRDDRDTTVEDSASSGETEPSLLASRGLLALFHGLCVVLLSTVMATVATLDASPPASTAR